MDFFVEQPIANFVNQLTPLGNQFGGQLVNAQLRQGFTVIMESNQQADFDISGDAFDFVRSIRVYHIQYSQSEKQDDRCRRQDATRLGRYGLQGDFTWSEAQVADVPSAAGLGIPSGCGSYRYRAVFVDWRDHAGDYGFELVRY